jgi:glycyl-tRNA synthetase
MEGIHSRTDFDVSRHQEFSGKNLLYVDQSDGNKKYLPYVLETSVGCDRFLLAILSHSYQVETLAGDAEREESGERTVLKISPQLAPVQVAIMPLVKKPELEDIADQLKKEIIQEFSLEVDVSGSIGKRYRRQDEIGTPKCITIDFETLNDQSVTIRDRDHMTQERISLDQCRNYLCQFYSKGI